MAVIFLYCHTSNARGGYSLAREAGILTSKNSCSQTSYVNLFTVHFFLVFNNFTYSPDSLCTKRRYVALNWPTGGKWDIRRIPGESENSD